ncbi:MAG: hypothetical protein OXU31_07385 [Gammaproteobacteria bacterium]|nr:hypothetical protein [Gammaproteobacteria bacterium]
MITFPYTDIINDAPAPLVIIFGMAHAAMAWIVFAYAKFFYYRIVGFAVKKAMLSEEKAKHSLNQDEVAAHLNTYANLVRDKDLPNIFGFGLQRNIKEEVKRLMQESPIAHVVKCTAFGVCWAIIDTVKYIYG